MVQIFDGKKYVAKEFGRLSEKVAGLQKKGITPKLSSLLIGSGKRKNYYTLMKKKTAERAGIIFEIIKIGHEEGKEKIIEIIKNLNEDDKVHGIMIQMPIGNNFTKKDKCEIINSIKSDKDVDGMRNESPFVAPVVKAVVYTLSKSGLQKERPGCVVVGGEGFVGRKIRLYLNTLGYDVISVDKNTKDFKLKIGKADIIISVTGSKGLIKGSMVKKGVVVVDVGYPRGDVSDSVYKKAGFVTPVPGGIGPLTIAFLMQNLVEAVY